MINQPVILRPCEVKNLVEINDEIKEIESLYKSSKLASLSFDMNEK